MTGERRVALISDAAGYVVAVSDDARDLSRAEVTERLVTLAVERFGRLDAAVAFTGRIVVGRFLRSSVDDLRDALVGCVEAPYQFLRGRRAGNGRARWRPGPGVHERRRCSPNPWSTALFVGTGRGQHADPQRR